MKRHLVLEYRVRKLERAILEDIDSDLDKMSDDILKRMPNDDLDADLDKQVSTLVGKQIKSRHNTINDWIDSMVFNNEIDAEDKTTGLKYAITHLNGMLYDLTSARLKEGALDFGLHRTAEIKRSIRELSNTNLLIANQKIVSALRKKIRELESELNLLKGRKRLESLTYEGKRDLDLLKSYLGYDLYDSYMSIRNKIPSDADLNRQYPEFTEDDIANDEKLFIKKYSNVRNSNIVEELGDRLFSKYPKSISSEDLHDNVEQCISDYNDIVNFVKQSFNNFRSFERLKKMDVDDIRDFVNSYISVRASKDSDKIHGAKKLYEDSDWVVYRITSYNAAKYYGKNTRWCISGNYPGHEGLGEKYFKDYIKNYSLDGGYYFYINKRDPNEKYCVLKKKSGNVESIWNASDTDLGKSMYWADLDLPYVKDVGLNTAEQEDLLFAIEDGDLEMVKQCVNDNTINAVTPTGWTPLMIAAAKSGHSAIEIAEYLIDNGADVSYVSKDGKSALVVASESGLYEMVRLLVEHGHADVNNPMTEYGSAAYLGTDDEDIEEYLINNGAKIN